MLRVVLFSRDEVEWIVNRKMRCSVRARMFEALSNAGKCHKISSRMEREGLMTFVNATVARSGCDDSSSFSVQRNEVKSDLIAITGDGISWQKNKLSRNEMMYKIAALLRCDVFWA